VQVGHGGLSDAVLGELERALTAHGLIKVKINLDREARDEIAKAICEKTDAAVVHRVGKITVLWRPTPTEDAQPAKDRTAGPETSD